MAEVVVALERCPACASSDIDTIQVLDEYKQRMCNSCGNKWVKPKKAGGGEQA